MKLKIAHITQYTYKNPVIDSVNELRLTPTTDEHQLCHTHSLAIEPNVPLFSSTDYFGNVTHFFTLNTPHQQLTITMDAIVETNTLARKQSTLSRDEEIAIYQSETFQNEYAEYLMETPYTILVPDVYDFVETAIQAENVTTTYELLEKMSNAIYTHFTYDPSATTVHTTLEETLHLKRGVCQDYAHFMIGICRIFHIPARYVSGYHFIGDPENNDLDVQHASHAWVEALIPHVGWIPFDPTNNGLIDWRYVKTSHGRDYNDVAPVKGVYKGTAAQDLTVSVHVEYLKI